jgi:hypothetical protein
MGFPMRKTRIEPKRQTTRPWQQSDRAFAVTSVALIVFLAVAGIGAWIAQIRTF